MCYSRSGVGGCLGAHALKLFTEGQQRPHRIPKHVETIWAQTFISLFYCLALHRRECQAGPQAVWIMSEAVRIRFLDESPDQTKEVGVWERCEERWWEETDLLFQLSASLRKAPLACETGQGTSWENKILLSITPPFPFLCLFIRAYFSSQWTGHSIKGF